MGFGYAAQMVGGSFGRPRPSPLRAAPGIVLRIRGTAATGRWGLGGLGCLAQASCPGGGRNRAAGKNAARGSRSEAAGNNAAKKNRYRVGRTSPAFLYKDMYYRGLVWKPGFCNGSAGRDYRLLLLTPASLNRLPYD